MTVHRTTLACCVVFSAFLPGCSHSVPVQSYTEPDAVPPTPVVLEVENHNWADVVLYVLHDASIQIPSQLQRQMGIIRIAARRIGGTDSFVSQAISLRGNSAVRFTIESSLNRSSVGVW